MHLAIRFGIMYEEDALRLAQRLFARFDEAIETLALVPGADGEFSLSLNGRLLHAQGADEMPPRVAHVVAALANTSPPGSLS